MLRIVAGAFQPELEQSCLEEIRGLKSADPLASLVLLVPSHPLKIRLAQLVCHEHGQTLLNVRILTFHQFALDLLNEAGRRRPEWIPSETVFPELVGAVLRHHAASLSAWQSFLHVSGAWEALWRTIRDLKNAGLDAHRIDALLEDPDLGEISRQRAFPLSRILRLATRVLDAKARLGALDNDDVLIHASEVLVDSPLLRQCRRVICYGVYDLNQLQVDFFQALVRACSVTLYIPLLRGHPAFVFAQQFFDRYIQGLRPSPADNALHESAPARSAAHWCVRGQPCSRLRHLFEQPGAIHPMHETQGPDVRLLDQPSPSEEIAFVAKDILAMVEDKGYAFDEIGVVARSLQGYELLIPRIFAEHRIPLAGSLSRPLADYPLARVVQWLLEVKETAYRRDRVLELLGSPFFRLPGQGDRAHRVFRDEWEVITRRMGITKGLDQWRRLAAPTNHDMVRSNADCEADDRPPFARIPTEAMQSLWDIVKDLHADLQRFPDRARWADFVELVSELCDRYLNIPSEGCSIDRTGTLIDQGGSAVVQVLRRGLDDLRALTAIEPEISFADFVAAVRRLLRRLRVPVADGANVGVSVLDAMEARGLSFRILYIVGVNDDRFPRAIHEDAFLRDSERRRIDMDLGYKLPEKLAAIHEERLLWFLLANSARDALVLSYPRADEGGRPLVPSSFILEVERVLGSLPPVRMPRAAKEKVDRMSHYRGTRLLPRDLSILWLATRQSNHHLLHRVHPGWPLIDRAMIALQEHERLSRSLGSFDGCVGPLDHLNEALMSTGCSPTSFDEYSLCPFRYFANRVLQIEELPDPGAVEEVGPAAWGTMIHDILRETYASLHAEGYFTGSACERLDPLTRLDDVARRVFSRFAAEAPVGYPMLWEARCEQIRSFLARVVHEDLADLAATGWQPVLFEQPLRGMIQEETGIPLTIRGRLDRVDRHRTQQAIRIVDYKCRWSSRPDTHDTDLALSAVRARRFQPPLYVAAASPSVAGSTLSDQEEAALHCEGIWFYYLAPRWRSDGSDTSDAFVRAVFPGDAWRSSLRKPLQRAITTVLEGIRSGRFFIRPSSHCEHCAYVSICRKTHDPTRWRARRDPHGVASLEHLSRTSLPKQTE